MYQSLEICFAKMGEENLVCTHFTMFICNGGHYQRVLLSATTNVHVAIDEHRIKYVCASCVGAAEWDWSGTETIVVDA